ncbi:hypothetical protein Q8G32_28485 [Priestia megaterium]|uniref:hypothetical protein n=1 Tax=Priestia megaterium TaxID=1404 RepID=UPI0027322636|nr:hypothetical protein [Priestia megaterium]MDP1471780.1 hypothetical protein [Priestia megaterium]
MDVTFWFFVMGIVAAFLLFGYQLVISKKIDLPKGWPAFSAVFGGMTFMLLVYHEQGGTKFYSMFGDNSQANLVIAVLWFFVFYPILSLFVYFLSYSIIRFFLFVFANGKTIGNSKILDYIVGPIIFIVVDGILYLDYFIRSTP